MRIRLSVISIITEFDSNNHYDYVSISIRRITGEIDRTPEELVDFIDIMLQDHIRGAAMRLGRLDELQK